MLPAGKASGPTFLKASGHEFAAALRFSNQFKALGHYGRMGGRGQFGLSPDAVFDLQQTQKQCMPVVRSGISMDSYFSRRIIDAAFECTSLRPACGSQRRAAPLHPAGDCSSLALVALSWRLHHHERAPCVRLKSRGSSRSSLRRSFRRALSLSQASQLYLSRCSAVPLELQDITLTWINLYFKLDVVNPRDLTAKTSEGRSIGARYDATAEYDSSQAGFPIIVLTMMDVIYPKKVRWHQAGTRHIAA